MASIDERARCPKRHTSDTCRTAPSETPARPAAIVDVSEARGLAAPADQHILGTPRQKVSLQGTKGP
jgi:hypothetical protein